MLVLSPTRELAAQIAESFKTYGRHTGLTVAVMYGGVPHRPQVNAMSRGVDVLVATPGRLMDHVEQRSVVLSGTEILVLDEADQMLDMGFIRPIRQILSKIPATRQSLFFSATMPRESDSGSRFRVIRAVKNRFGAANEIGVFAMEEGGLREVRNPSAIFLSRGKDAVPGSAVTVAREGTRQMLIEVQGLVDPSPLANPRRVAVGFEANRVALLLAVLHRHAGIAVHAQDVFVNVVGGVRLIETAADLAVVAALLSSLSGKPLAQDLAVFGELGLTGEIRPVPYGEDRLREAAKHGFRRAIVPLANAPRVVPAGIAVTPVASIAEAIDALG